MPGSPPEWVWSLRMRLPFCILNVLGDVLDNGELHFVEAARTLGAARRRIKALAKSSPGQYVIYNGQTGERLPVVSSAKPRSLYLRASIRQKHRTILRGHRSFKD